MSSLLTLRTILDCVEWWSVSWCTNCGAFVDVAGVPCQDDDLGSYLQHCPECVIHFAPVEEKRRFANGFRRLRDLRLELGLGENTIQDPAVFEALGADQVTLVVRSPQLRRTLEFGEGPARRPYVEEFVIHGLGQQVPGPDSSQHLSRFPVFFSRAPFPLFPDNTPWDLTQIKTEALSLGIHPVSGYAEVILGRDVFVPTVPGGRLQHRWNPSDPSQPYTMTLSGWDQLTRAQLQTLLVEGMKAIRRESRRGRPRRTRYTIPQLIDAAISYHRECGRWPTKERLAERLDIQPSTVTNTLKHGTTMSYKNLLEMCTAVLDQQNHP
jgi:hypothetical protein